MEVNKLILTSAEAMDVIPTFVMLCLYTFVSNLCFFFSFICKFHFYFIDLILHCFFLAWSMLVIFSHFASNNFILSIINLWHSTKWLTLFNIPQALWNLNPMLITNHDSSVGPSKVRAASGATYEGHYFWYFSFFSLFFFSPALLKSQKDLTLQTLQTFSPTNFRSCWWGAERRV